MIWKIAYKKNALLLCGKETLLKETCAKEIKTKAGYKSGQKIKTEVEKNV